MATLTTYDATQGRDLTPVLEIIQASQPSFLSVIKFGTPVAVQKKIEWYDITDSPIADSLDGGVTATDTTITVHDGTKFTTGDRILIKDANVETFRVSVATHVLTVLNADGTGATLASDHASGVVIVNLTTPVLEGSSSTGDAVDNATLLYNYSEIFKRSLKISGSQLSEKLDETDMDTLAYYTEQKMIQIYREINNAALFGERYIGTGTHPRLTGGINWWLTDTTHGTPINTDHGGVALTLAAIDDLVAAQFNVGGSSDAIVCSTGTSRKITALARALGGVEIVVSREDTVTGNTISAVQGDFVGGGIRQIVVDANMPDGVLFLVNTSDVSVEPLAGRNVSLKEKSSDGDYELWQILGEYAVKVMHPYNNHARLYDFTV